MKTYMVGGCVRDEIMGVPSNDIDFSVVLEASDFAFPESEDPYKVMLFKLNSMGVKVFRSDKDENGKNVGKNKGVPIGAEFLTARGNLKDYGAVDFVLARKDGTYTDGRRPDSVEIGTLEDDLKRRDFTMNAIAKDTDGVLIDPFNGRTDIAARLIRTVGDPLDRFTEDALRPLRALRFSVTKGFKIDTRTAFAMQDDEVLNLIVNKVSDDRKRVEIEKMFRFDTLASLKALGNFPSLTEAVFAGRLSLDASLKTKGRGK